ncbi:MAG: hypothetical protein HKO82_03850 [Acidimicrobiia bacterium]|nr:hypothetical protein [Acidimicrobiia bacterium]
MIHDHTTARALTSRYRTTRPAGRKARRNRPPIQSARPNPVGRPVTAT